MKVVGLLAAMLLGVLALASPAAARDLTCNGVFKGKTYDDVKVPRGGACTITGARIRGDVRVLKDAYLQTRATTVRGDVEGMDAQTVFIDSGSKVGGSVEAVKTAQFYVFNSSIGEDIEPERPKRPCRSAATPCAETSRWPPPRNNAIVTSRSRCRAASKRDVTVTRNFSLVELCCAGTRRGGAGHEHRPTPFAGQPRHGASCRQLADGGAAAAGTALAVHPERTLSSVSPSEN
jgi:hypothetical protein